MAKPSLGEVCVHEGSLQKTDLRMRSKMCLLFLLVLLSASHGMTQSAASTASSSGGLRCTQRNGTSLTVLIDVFMTYMGITGYLQTIVDSLSGRFPCVTRQYTSVLLDYAETNVTITNDKSVFLKSLTRNYDDSSGYAYYYAHLTNCNQSLLYGLKRSLEISPAESIILVYTFGSMVDYNDTRLLSDVYTLLKDKNSRVYFLWYPSLFSVSASQQDVFDKISSLSYGDLLNIQKLTPFQAVQALVSLLSKPLNSSVRILNINSNVTDNYTAGFNVSSSLTHLLIAGNQLIIFNFTDPNGNKLTYEKNPNYNNHHLNDYSGIIPSVHLVKSPAGGSWTLNAQGNGPLAVHILGFTGLGNPGTCLDSGCHPNATCSEFGGYGECTCKPGFAGDGKSCDDIDECQSYTTNNCYYYGGGYCENTIGSYTCNCYSGSQYKEGFGCVDIDECADKSLNDCDPVAICTNYYYGSYRCDCPYGYYGDGRHCEVNECQQGSPCGSSSTIDCMKYTGSYSCIDPCSQPTVLNDSWRSTSNVYNTSKGNDWYHCDFSLSGWYRFIGEYDQQIPEHCVQQQSCGTGFPIWMNSSHPTVSDGIVNRTVCPNYYDGCCTQPYNISVRTCPGGFYVYKLQSPQYCSAYCTESNNRCSGIVCAPDEECRNVSGVRGCNCKNSSNSAYGSWQGSLGDYITPQVTCGLENIKGRISKCFLEQLGYDTSSIHLRDDSCRGVIERSDKSYLTLVTRPTNGSCGGNIQKNGSNITYSNTVYLTAKSNNVIITRNYSIDFNCSYPSDMEANLLTANSSYVTSAITAYGTSNFTITMGLLQDSNYTNLYTGSEVLMDSSSTLFVGVIVTGDTKSSPLVVAMSNCYVTPTSDNSYGTRYDIITNQCPNKNDTTVLENGVSLRGRFSFQVFNFLSSSSQIYLHCQVGLCDTSSSNCSAKCPSTGSTLAAADKVQNMTVGPIKLKSLPTTSKSPSTTSKSPSTTSKSPSTTSKSPSTTSKSTAARTTKLFISAIVLLLLLY